MVQAADHGLKLEAVKLMWGVGGKRGGAQRESGGGGEGFVCKGEENHRHSQTQVRSQHRAGVRRRGMFRWAELVIS